MAAVAVNYEMHLKAWTGLSLASNNPFPKSRIVSSNSDRGRIGSFSLTCKSHSPGANLVFPPSLPSSSSVWLRWQVECGNFWVLRGFRCGCLMYGVLRHALYVLKLIDQQELHFYCHVFRFFSHFATQINISNGNAPLSRIRRHRWWQLDCGTILFHSRNVVCVDCGDQCFPLWASHIQGMSHALYLLKLID